MKIVPPCGLTNRPLIAIVGEAPGAEEERAGQPFVGASGFLLNQMLSAAGIVRQECYITNVSKVRPPSNNFLGMYYENSNPKFPSRELLRIRDETRQEILAIQPKVVIALGKEALSALTPYSSIKDYRGTMVDWGGLRVLPTYHPAYLLRGQFHERPIVECDLKKAIRQARSPHVPRYSFNEDPTFSECIEFLKDRPHSCAYDIETLGYTPITRCVGFATSRYDAISIPLIKGREHAWAPDQEAEILEEMSKFFRSPYIKFLVQNKMFDDTVMARELGFHVRNCHIDTMLAHHLMFPELPKSLDFLSSIYTDHPLYWHYNSGDWRSTARYNCYDCIVTYEVAEKEETELRELGMWNFYQTVVHRAVTNLLRVQSHGVKIDIAERQKIRDDTEAQVQEIIARLRTTTHNPTFSPASPKQVMELVYDKWKLPRQINPKTKRPTTDDDALSALAKKNPIYEKPLKDILDFRQKRVLISTFCEMPLRDSRVYTSYNVGGTVTGRLSSSSTPDGIGGNLQNIPRGDFRRIFVADPGKVLIKADLSQAEYRVLIWKARIHRVIERWTADPTFNIHMWNASENIYKIPIAQVTKQQYQNAKNGVYAGNYKVGALKISRMYNIEYREAKFILDNYYTSVPEIGAYWAEIEDEVRRTRKITNPLGRERVFLGRMDDELYRAAYSHYCQSTVADLILLALNDLVEGGIDVLLQVHDELVVQCDESDVERCVVRVRQAMERPIEIPGVSTPLVIPAEIKVGRDWYNTMPLEKWKESQLGLKKSQDKENATATV